MRRKTGAGWRRRGLWSTAFAGKHRNILLGQMELVIFVGLPGAGKTTFYRERFAGTHEHVSKDNFPSARRPEKRQRRMLAEALGAGKLVVLDNTNPSPEERIASIEIAKAHGARVVAYYFELTSAESIERNSTRPEPDRVPNVGVYATAKRLRRPALSEGFDAIFVVRAENGEFIVSEFKSPQGYDNLTHETD